MNIQPGIYRHYKGNTYRVLGLAHHSETVEPMVVYQALYESADFGMNALWARPLELFVDTVEWNGVRVSRFTHIGN